MPNEIFVVKSMADALRNTGYKNIESAMAEIVDNSIQALAHNVFVVVKETVNPRSGRKNVTEVAFIDNGTGMNDVDLGRCLAYGYSTRTDRKGMGRFGVGLPQASMHACPSVEVYSWQDDYKNCKTVFLDVEKVRRGEQEKIQDPVPARIPKEYEKYLNYTIVSTKEKVSFSSHGTVVVWKNCDRVIPKTVGTLFEKLLFTLGQKFRYFILEESCSIYLIEHGNPTNIKKIVPNDPLLLMKNNLVLGNINRPGVISEGNAEEGFIEPIFESYCKPDNRFYDKETDSLKVPVKYFDSVENKVKESFVYLKFSVVRYAFYAKDAVVGDAGDTQIGKHVKKLEGISIVRANREIDFGQFDFYENINAPTHRWWGCEIKFNPELDEAFGVANNKQHVELHRVDASDYDDKDDEVKPMWLQLAPFVVDTIKAMFKRNQETRKNSRVKPSNSPTESPSERIINSVEKNRNEGSATGPNDGAEQEPSKEDMEGAKQILEENGRKNPTEEEIRSYLNNSVNIFHKAMRNAPLFDASSELGTISVCINMDHPFYKNYLETPLSDPDFQTAFELFIASLVKVMQETSSQYGEANDDLLSRWNERLRAYIYEQMHPCLTEE